MIHGESKSMKGDHKNRFFLEVNKFHPNITSSIEMPPVFLWLEGEIVTYDKGCNTLINRFPLKRNYINPYNIIQGGIITAFIDNTIGPLSMTMARNNLTRTLSSKFKRPLQLEDRFAVVTATVEKMDDRLITFKARVDNLEGRKVASAQALHYILD